MKKYTFFTLLLFTLFTFISCFAVDFFSTEVEIPGVEWEISESQRKEVYTVNDAVTLKLSFPPDFEKFKNYRLGLNVYIEGGDETYNAILISPTKNLVFDDSWEITDSKIQTSFNLVFNKTGKFYIMTYLYGTPKKYDKYNYLTWKYLFFTVE